MNFEFTVKEIKSKEFPLEMVKRNALEARTQKFVMADGYVLDNEHDRAMFAGFQTRNARHKLPDSKIKHECFETLYDTHIHGHLVEYRYKFCELCKDYFEKRTVIFDNKNNRCAVLNYA